MPKNYYQVLSIREGAGLDEIKRAFRREIARYHPDKVAHLGPEFLGIAEARAAELTEAYRVLTDPVARAQYDGRAPSSSAPKAPSPAPPAAPEEDRPGSVAAPDAAAAPASDASAHAFSEERATKDEFVRRASIARFRSAVAGALGRATAAPARGFDAAFVVKPKRGLFGKGDPPQHVLARFVPVVDGAALEETWVLALKAALGGGATSVFVMGGGLARVPELAGRIADLRRKPQRSGAAPVLVPVDVRDWDALVPTEAPPLVKAILELLRRPA